MYFVIRCLDKPDSQQIRQDNRPAHLDYLQSYHDRLFAAGPILDDNETMCGSILILDLADRAEAEAFAAGDPYAGAGLFAQVSIDIWKKLLP